MILYHHTTKHCAESIVTKGYIYPLDVVWMTECGDLEVTAFCPDPKHRARVKFEILEDNVKRFNDVSDEFPHLNVGLLNAITDTSKWWIYEYGPLSVRYATVEIIEDGEWKEM